MLVNGEWQRAWDPYQKNNTEGEFLRETSSFRHWVTPDGSAGITGDAGFKAEAERYHLYVALICPWASRTLMVRKLKGLENIITVSVLEPFLTEQGWQFAPEKDGFPGAHQDPMIDATFIHQLYTKADNNFSGRATVPVLWDKKTHTIVNNESADIMQMFNSAFEAFTKHDINLRPDELVNEINHYNEWLYKKLNNGVYQAGFAKTQSAYESSLNQVFETLDKLENELGDNRQYIFGDAFTDTDIRAFVTLIRFDSAYHGLFKCNLKRITDYPYIEAYMARIYSMEGIAETVDMNHIKQGYYSVKALNPNGIVPVGPSSLFANTDNDAKVVNL
jgi:putative glutathione S-transferase